MSVELSRADKRKSNTAQPRRKLSRKFKNLMRIVFFALIFLVVIGMGFYYGDGLFASFMGGDGTPSAIVGSDEDTESSGSLDKDGPVNILLIGTDQRKDEPARSDTMILATLYPKDKDARLLSIPRDTKVRIPGKGTTKMSHAFAYGGGELAVETVEDLLGIPIDYRIETNFRGFKNIIDILGGVTLNVERRMYKPLEDIDLQKGVQTLDGYDSLAYVRWRDDNLADIGRIQRQEKFLKVLAGEAVSISTVWKIPDLIKELRENIRTDLGTKEILYLGSKYATMDSDNMDTGFLPGEPIYENGVSYWEADYFELEEIIDRMQTQPAILAKQDAEERAAEAEAEERTREDSEDNNDRDNGYNGNDRNDRSNREYKGNRLRANKDWENKQLLVTSLSFLRR